MMAEQGITWQATYLSAAGLLGRDWVMVLSFEMAWMEIMKTLGSLLGVNSLFGIFVASMRLIILVPVMGH
jgi:hypothetical protein